MCRACPLVRGSSLGMGFSACFSKSCSSMPGFLESARWSLFPAQVASFLKKKTPRRTELDRRHQMLETVSKDVSGHFRAFPGVSGRFRAGVQKPSKWRKMCKNRLHMNAQISGQIPGVSGHMGFFMSFCPFCNEAVLGGGVAFFKALLLRGRLF